MEDRADENRSVAHADQSTDQEAVLPCLGHARVAAARSDHTLRRGRHTRRALTAADTCPTSGDAQRAACAATMSPRRSPDEERGRAADHPGSRGGWVRRFVLGTGVRDLFGARSAVCRSFVEIVSGSTGPRSTVRPVAVYRVDGRPVDVSDRLTGPTGSTVRRVDGSAGLRVRPVEGPTGSTVSAGTGCTDFAFRRLRRTATGAPGTAVPVAIL